MTIFDALLYVYRQGLQPSHLLDPTARGWNDYNVLPWEKVPLIRPSKVSLVPRTFYKQVAVFLGVKWLFGSFKSSLECVILGSFSVTSTLGARAEATVSFESTRLSVGRFKLEPDVVPGYRVLQTLEKFGGPSSSD